MQFSAAEKLAAKTEPEMLPFKIETAASGARMDAFQFPTFTEVAS